MNITKQQLLAIMPNAMANISVNPNYKGYAIDKIVELLNKYAAESNINTRFRWIHFLANIAVETGEFRRTEENLNYSSEGLRKIFPKYFPTLQVASLYANNPRKIANKVYGNRYGNGNEASGDGYKYRGRGCLQYTFKANYVQYAKFCGYDVVNDPDKLAQPIGSIRSAAHFFDVHGCNIYADKDNAKMVRKIINGGDNGLTECIKYVTRGKHAIV